MDKQTVKRFLAALLGALAALSLLFGCSTVGPGFKNHPGDCAIGIPWADCLPGTPGYNNGGGRVHREEVQQQNATIEDQFKNAKAQCAADIQSRDLDPIRHKVELTRDSPEAPPPFEIASNDTFPTEAERPAIAGWATIRDECIRRTNAVSNIPPSANPMQVTFLQQVRAFGNEDGGRVSELIVALYQQKLTYGEFAQKRYEISRDAVAAERQFRQSVMVADQQRQMQAQQLAQQQFHNNLMAWSVYMQSVSARQPQTVHLEGMRRDTHCTSFRTGNIVNTDCY